MTHEETRNGWKGVERPITYSLFMMMEDILYEYDYNGFPKGSFGTPENPSPLSISTAPTAEMQDTDDEADAEEVVTPRQGSPGRITMRLIFLREANELIARTPPRSAPLDIHVLYHWAGQMGLQAPKKVLYLMCTLIHHFQEGLSMETTSADLATLYRRINQLATGALRQCPVTKHRTICNRECTQVYLASFQREVYSGNLSDAEAGTGDEDDAIATTPLPPPSVQVTQVHEAIVKYIPSSELYVAIMETFIQFFLRRILQLPFVGEVYQIFFPTGAQDDGGKICIATEKVGTCDLKDVLSNNIQRTYRILHNIAVHLHTLQRKCRFVHGDLKPDNIRVRLVPDGPTEIFFIDFGHSKIALRGQGASYFELYSFPMSEDYLPEGNYKYDPRVTLFDKDAFSGDLLYLTLMLFYQYVEGGERVETSPLGARLIRDFFTFTCKDGTVVRVAEHIAKCPHDFREYVLSKDFTVLFHWVPITDPEDQDRFLLQFRPVEYARRIRRVLGLSTKEDA
jgi:hypothetical protein